MESIIKVLSEELKQNLVSAAIHSDVYGSDHCPVETVINI